MFCRLALAWLPALLAVPAFAFEAPQRIVLDPGGGTDPAVEVVSREGGRLKLALTLPAMELQELSIEGEVFQIPIIPGAVLRGEAGRPDLPVISRLVAIPAGAQPRIACDDAQRDPSQQFERRGLRIFPAQPASGEAFVYDRDYYAGRRTQADAALRAPNVSLGEPAWMGGLRVLPVFFHPLAFDPEDGTLTISRRVEVELDLGTESAGESESTKSSFIPESFDALYSDLVLNYERAADAATGPGTYLLIYRNDPQVLGRLAPLIDWRKRQGYSVRVASSAETGTTEYSVKAFIQGIYDTADPPLEFICIAGDAAGSYTMPTWHENLSTYHGEGDHYFTTLAGSDYLADAHVGRLSFDSLATLELIISKIISYETSPPLADSGWFSRACVAGDPSDSGITTIYVNQWLKQQLLADGYTQVDSLWSPNPNSMSSAINQGLSVFGYRGFWGLSGMTSGYINALTNGMELPFAVVPTCGTGSFAQETNCQSEAFLRAPNGGAIGCIGTATLGTHTRYNNCFYTGCWQGAVNGSSRRLGAAHTRGKLELYLNYSGWDDAEAEIWSVWNNLMGDPATELRSRFPQALSVAYPGTLPVGANAMPLLVTAGGSPVAGARVALVKEGELRVTGVTGAFGELTLPIGGVTSGILKVTATCRNYLPFQGQATLGSSAVFAAYESCVVDDDGAGGSAGNGDGTLNPGETIELPLALRNVGFGTAANVSAQIAADDPYVTLIDDSESFGNIAPGAVAWSVEDYDFALAADAPDGHEIAFVLEAASGANHWTSLVELEVASAAFTQEGFTWTGPGGNLDPGESGSFLLSLRNTGSTAATGITAMLECTSPWIVPSDSLASYPDLAPGQSGVNNADPFILGISPNCFGGHVAAFRIILTFDGGRIASAEFTLSVGSATSVEPTGPDGFGYYAFDNTDTAYPWAPIYDWVEIDPSRGGSGQSVGLTDFGYEDDDTAVLDLPFLFTYYGEVYDRISVCSNGWIAMGVSALVNFRNWAIPAAGGPNAMIAPFWDNLFQSQDNQVYSWHDTQQHRFIVEWSRMRNCIQEVPDHEQTFELILYDPAFYPPPTGNGEILFQYHTVSNSDWRDGRASVGIQNGDRSLGLGYSYAGAYAPGGAGLAAGRAIRFVHMGLNLVLGNLEGEVLNASDGNAPLTGIPVRILEQNQTLLSGESGHYAGLVPVGTFTVYVQHESFETVQVEGVEILEGETTVLNFPLIDILGPGITGTTVLEDTDDQVGPYVVESSINDYSQIVERRFFYTLGNGPVHEAPLILVDEGQGRWRAEIPGQPGNTIVHYWLEAEDAAGNRGRDPEQDGSYYEFFVLQGYVLIADDFESNQGWTLSDPEDNAVAGIWVREDPHGTWDGIIPVQPEDDASPLGGLCWITGNLDTTDPGADDVDGGRSSLYSPVFDLSQAMSAAVSYKRWFVNDTGSEPGFDYWKVFVSNGGSNWVPLEFTHTPAHGWVEKTFALENYITLSGTVQFRFIASDDGLDSEIEAGLDDFTIGGLMLPDETAAPDESAAPAGLVLRQNRPNPFNPRTSIEFGLPSAAAVSLRIYDISGRLVRRLLDGYPLPEGFHRFDFDGRDESGRSLGSGVYLYRIEAGGEGRAAKMILLK